MTPTEVFTLRPQGSTLVLEVHGTVSSLADEGTLKQLDEILDQIRAGAVNDVLIDFGQSPYFGSCLLEALRLIWTDIHPREGRMVLCNVSPVGREILEIAKFDQLWPVVATRAEGEQRLQTVA